MAIIFQDQFERAGDIFSPPWTGTFCPPWAGTLTEPLLNPHHGLRSCRSMFQAGGAQAYCYYDWAGVADAWARAYLMMDTFPVNVNEFFNFHFLWARVSNVFACVQVRRTAGGVFYGMRYQNAAGTMVDLVSAASPVLNRYDCLEIRLRIGGVGVGLAELYLNEVLILSTVGVDFGAANVDEALAGLTWNEAPQPAMVSAFTDCFVLGDAQVYCEPLFGGGSKINEAAKIILDA